MFILYFAIFIYILSIITNIWAAIDYVNSHDEDCPLKDKSFFEKLDVSFPMFIFVILFPVLNTYIAYLFLTED